MGSPMDSLVLQLQKECLDSRTPVIDVLRKALVVAKKLKVPEFQHWIDNELQGYRTTDAIPNYRIVTGQLQAWNPYQGYIPVLLADPRLAKLLSERPIGQPIGELEMMIQNPSADSTFEIPLQPEVERKLMRGMAVRLRPTLHVTNAAIKGIIDTVRTTVLNWCLKLEEAGILGEGMVFSSKEKETASQVNYHVSFHAPVGVSQIQQGTTESSQSISIRMDLNGLRTFIAEAFAKLDQLKLQSALEAQLVAELKCVEAQLSAPRPKHAVITECLHSIRNVLEGCTGSLVATGLLNALSALLPH